MIITVVTLTFNMTQIYMTLTFAIRLLWYHIICMKVNEINFAAQLVIYMRVT